MSPIPLLITSFAAMGLFGLLIYAVINITTERPQRIANPHTKSEEQQSVDTMAINALHFALNQKERATTTSLSTSVAFAGSPFFAINPQNSSVVIPTGVPGAAVKPLSPQAAVEVERLIRQDQIPVSSRDKV